MKAKTFIQNVKELLGIDIDSDMSKRKSVNSLLEKLQNKRKYILEDMPKSKREDLELELSIVDLKIKKGEKILQRLNEKKKKK